MTALLTESWVDTETGLPHGFAVRLAPETKVADGGSTLFGSTTGRLLYLSPPAVRALAGDTVTVVDETSRTLARTLLDRDLAHPVWDGGPPRYDDPEDVALVTMVVPVRDRPEGSAGCSPRCPRCCGWSSSTTAPATSTPSRGSLRTPARPWCVIP